MIHRLFGRPGRFRSVGLICALLIGMGVFTGLIGILADLIAVNRKLLEKLLAREGVSAAANAGSRVRGRSETEAA